MLDLFKRRNTDNEKEAKKQPQTFYLGRGNNGEKSVEVGSTNKTISRNHCRITLEHDGRLLLYDTSINGTGVNGVNLNNQSLVLHDGDSLALGSTNPVAIKVIFGNDGFVHLMIVDDNKKNYVSTGIRSPQKTPSRPIQEEDSHARSIDEHSAPKERKDLQDRQIVLQLYRKHQNGIATEELAQWLQLPENSKTHDTNLLLKKSLEDDGFRESLPQTSFIEPITIGNQSLEVAKTIYEVEDRTFVPIILDGKFLLVYLSLSRKVFVRLRVATPTDHSNAWYVKTMHEAINDLPPNIDRALKKIIAHHSEIRRKDVRSDGKVSFLKSFGMYCTDQVEATDEAARSLHAAKDQGKIIEINHFPHLGDTPTAVYVDKLNNNIELTYDHTIFHNDQPIIITIRVHVALDSANQPFINVTAYNDKYFVAGVPEHKTVYRGGAKLNQQANRNLEPFSLNKPHSEQVAEAIQFFESFKDTYAYNEAARCLQNNSDYFPERNETVKNL